MFFPPRGRELTRCEMTERELLATIEDAYTSFIHLDDGVEAAIAKVADCENKVSNSLIDNLLKDGESWRERLLGLVLGATRGIDQFYDSLIAGLHKSGGISIVPSCACLAVAVRDRGCVYCREMTASLDRDRWDGEIGFAMDWFHYSIGIGDAPRESIGPNYGQDYSKHLEFYTKLNHSITGT